MEKCGALVLMNTHVHKPVIECIGALLRSSSARVYPSYKERVYIFFLCPTIHHSLHLTLLHFSLHLLGVANMHTPICTVFFPCNRVWLSIIHFPAPHPLVLHLPITDWVSHSPSLYTPTRMSSCWLNMYTSYSVVLRHLLFIPCAMFLCARYRIF